MPMQCPAVLLILAMLASLSWAQEIPPGWADSSGVAIFEQLQGVESMEEIETRGPVDSPARVVRAPPETGHPWKLDFRTRLSGKLHEAVGYRSGEYAGNRWKLYNRIRLDLFDSSA